MCYMAEMQRLIPSKNESLLYAGLWVSIGKWNTNIALLTELPLQWRDTLNTILPKGTQKKHVLDLPKKKYIYYFIQQFEINNKKHKTVINHLYLTCLPSGSCNINIINLCIPTVGSQLSGGKLARLQEQFPNTDSCFWVMSYPNFYHAIF